MPNQADLDHNKEGKILLNTDTAHTHIGRGFSFGDMIHNIIIGLAVSIILLNLGAALGILSGRGAFAGMLSAGIIAVITSSFGGTRIQGSGLTAPMSTVTAVIVAYASENLPTEVAGISADHFVNIVLMMTAVILGLFAAIRLGRFIGYVPNLVVSGFMCGIALIIWVLQFKVLFGVGRAPIHGPILYNLAIAFFTLCIAFFAPVLVRKISPKLSSFLPGTLIALVLVSVVANLLNLPIGFLNVENNMSSLDEFTAYLSGQIPSHINAQIMWVALPYAFQLAALCYIDTLLTSLIVDKMRGSKSRQNKELAAQGVAIGAVAMLGGVPGAQSTVPSVLTIKEGATSRLAGISAGLFVIANMLLLADVMNYIPQAVFVGILVKVGYDVFDFKPLWAYGRTIKRQAQNRPSFIVGHREMAILTGTALATAFIDLIAAVGVFTIGFYIANKYAKKRKKPLIDYVPN